MRLQKYLANCGVASRRMAEKYIQEGLVTINGKITTELGTQINPSTDIIICMGKKITMLQNHKYIILNKPIGYITSTTDPFDRKTVLDLVNIKERIYPIGRLDSDTSGLLLLTSDGELAYKLTHPKHNITKTYIAKVRGIPNKKSLEKFAKGLKIDDYITSKAKIKIIKVLENASLCEIIIHEGKNRQVRKMCSAIGHDVLTLKRVALAHITLDELELGKWRNLTKCELDSLIKK